MKRVLERVLLFRQDFDVYCSQRTEEDIKRRASLKETRVLLVLYSARVATVEQNNFELGSNFERSLAAVYS